MIKKKILWGITGSIAIYKILDIIQALKSDFSIEVIMTKSAKKFINPLTFEIISGYKVHQDLFENPMVHINILKEKDIFIIAPASYNIIGKIANGIADDLLTTISSLANCRKIIAPAMHSHMFNNPILERNLKILKNKLNYEIISPEYGTLACGDIGLGKLRNKEFIMNYIQSEKKTLYSKKKILITLGSTIEKIDPVRYIGNLSSGKMGLSLAKAAKDLEADVELIYGHIQTKIPKYFKSTYASSHKEFEKLLQEKMVYTDILIMCAAISDYKPSSYSEYKIKEEKFSINFEKNSDILKNLEKRENQIFIGFSLETENLIHNAYQKCIEKNLDMIIANSSQFIQSNENEVYLIFPNSKKPILLKKKNKKQISFNILKKIYYYFLK